MAFPIVAWPSASHRSSFCVGMNMSAGGRDVKHFEWFYGLDTALYKNLPLAFFTFI